MKNFFLTTTLILTAIFSDNAAAQVNYADSLKSFSVVRYTPVDSKSLKDYGYYYYFFSKTPKVNEKVDNRIFYVAFNDTLVNESASNGLLKFITKSGDKLILLPLTHTNGSLSWYQIQLYLQQRCEIDRVSFALAVSEMIIAYNKVIKEGNPEKDWTVLLDFDIGRKK